MYVSRHKPYAHQQAALDTCKDKEAFAFLMAMRCVDGDTEYLSPEGWKKISEYTGGKVAEFRLDGTAHFVDPIQYIKSPVDQFWHFKTQGGVDQVLSNHHRILLCSRANATFGKVVGCVPDGFRTLQTEITDFWRETSPFELQTKGRRFKDHVPTSFFLETDTKLDMTDAEIRVMVAFHADGSFGKRDLSTITSNRKGVIRVKKDYKKKRIRKLLEAAKIPYEEREEATPGCTRFSFKPPRVSKTYGTEWWQASLEQRQVIAAEVCNWDGRTIKDKSDARYYSSIHKGDADFIQYCFVSCGMRASRSDTRKSDGTFGVHITGDGRTNNLALLPAPKPYEGPTDGMMYSFSVPSTYLVLRRNGKVFVTGNTGKTKTLLDDYGRLVHEGKVKDLLVIAPAGVYRTWETAIKDHVSEDLLKDLLIHCWSAGAGKTSQKSLDLFMEATDRPRVLLVNIEALSAVQRAKDLCEKFLSQNDSMCAVDESTGIKNPAASRTKFIVSKLGPRAKFRRILCGLPTPQSPLDIYAQFQFLKPNLLGFNSFYSFRARYAVMKTIPCGGRQVPIIVNYRDMDDLRRRIEPHAYRVLLEDCYDLPPKTYSIREVPLTDEQKRIYLEMKNFASSQLSNGSHVSATQAITQILRMHQVLCGHVGDEDGKIQSIPEKRTETLLDLLSEYDGKAIIWCSYDADVKKVSEALAKAYGGEKAVARFWGGNRPTREEEEQKFLNDPECRFMVATAAAGGRGRTWLCADLVVYYSNTQDLEHRSQSEERAQGVGKTRSVAYVDLVVRDTVDEKIIKALRNKINIAATLSGDGYKEWLI